MNIRNVGAAEYTAIEFKDLAMKALAMLNVSFNVNMEHFGIHYLFFHLFMDM